MEVPNPQPSVQQEFRPCSSGSTGGATCKSLFAFQSTLPVYRIVKRCCLENEAPVYIALALICTYSYMHLLSPAYILICTYSYLYIILSAHTPICTYPYDRGPICTHSCLHILLSAHTLVCTYSCLHILLSAHTLVCTYSCLRILLSARSLI